VSDSFVKRKPSAEGKQKNRHDEAPEVELLTVAEGVQLVRRLRASANTEEDENRVAVSTTEWIPSESIAALPVITEATNLAAAMMRFDAMAA